jgi:hypothetical protein
MGTARRRSGAIQASVANQEAQAPMANQATAPFPLAGQGPQAVMDQDNMNYLRGGGSDINADHLFMSPIYCALVDENLEGVAPAGARDCVGRLHMAACSSGMH